MIRAETLQRIFFVSLLGFGLLTPGSLLILGCSGCAIVKAGSWAEGCWPSAVVHGVVASGIAAFLGAVLQPKQLKSRAINWTAPLITGGLMFAVTPGLLLRLPGSLPDQLTSPDSFDKVIWSDVFVHALVFAALRTLAVSIGTRNAQKSMRLEVVPEPASGEYPKFLKLIAPTDAASVVATEWTVEDSKDAATIFTEYQGPKSDLSRKAYLAMKDSDKEFYLQLWSGQMQGYRAAAVANGFDSGGIIHDITEDSVYTESWGALYLETVALPSDHAGGKWYFNPDTKKLVVFPILAPDYSETDTYGLRRVRVITA